MLDHKNIPFSGNEELTTITHPYTGPLGDAIDKLNARYSFVMMSGRHKVFDHQEKIFCELDSVKIYQNQQLLHNEKVVNPATIWINERNIRRNFDDVVFKPYPTIDKAVKNHFNTWHGWAVPYADDMTEQEMDDYVKPWLNHIYNVFCSQDKEQFDYFVLWLAHMIQIPHKKPGVAIVLQSGQGFGKGIFVTLLSKIIGRSYVARVSEANHVAGGFSGQLKDKILINFDEATWGGDKKANGRLKALITEESLMLEEKFKSATETDHYARFFITSNNDYPVPIEHDDRRFFVPDVTTTKPEQKYFDKLGALLDNKRAISCFFSALMNYDLNDFSVRTFPNTKTRQKIKLESFSHNDMYKSFIVDASQEDDIAAQLMTKNIKASDLFELFMQWKARNPSFKNSPTSIQAFGRAMSEAGMEAKRAKHGKVYDITIDDVMSYLAKIDL